MAEAVIYNILRLLLILVGSVKSQEMDVSVTNTGICRGSLFKNVTDLKHSLSGCVVIVGSLEITGEQSGKKDFTGTPLYNLREITEYLVIYRVRGLESIGQLFPNLTRIRGNKLLNNYALIVYDNQNLREIGLYSLLKIDRGGVIMWGLPQACFVHTIDWKVLAPEARHVISPPDVQIECITNCGCSLNNDRNKCWNNKKCQLFEKGPESEECDDQCLGCRKTKKNTCFACRHYTYKMKCVSKCPSDTIVLPDSSFCITREECHDLGRITWNHTCIDECPIDFKLNNDTGYPTCEPCLNCHLHCPSLTIQSLGSIQNAERCVYINGSLIIHLRAIPNAMGDLKAYLGHIKEVSDYIIIEASDVITSLDFLSSLRVIKGQKLRDGKYSLYVSNNPNIQTLFTASVTKNLVIENGTAVFEHNPVLCMNFIDVIKDKFPIPPSEIDIPMGSNGYRGGCEEVTFNFTIKATSDTSVKITFPIVNHNIHYSALYVRLPPGVNSVVVPESCSEFEWHDADVPTIRGKDISIVELKTLQPASSYALCIEIYDPEKKLLSRSNIINFTTPVGVPEPPFIFELVASAPDVVVLRWVDHKNYIKHIKYYELDVALIEMHSQDTKHDYCKYTDKFFEEDDTRHALVRRPPSQYKKACESMCGVLSSVTPGAMVEEYFDVCEDKNIACNDNQEAMIMHNSTLGKYVKTLKFNLSSPRDIFRVYGLAPFSDYRFRLRACTEEQCSRSARGVVRTFVSKIADIPIVTTINANSSGIIEIKWAPPKVTNGPVLTSSVEVLPKINGVNLMPQVWCVSGIETEVSVKSIITAKYLVRVCLRTLGVSKSCSVWRPIILQPTDLPKVPYIPSQIRPTSKMDLLWTGVIFGILIYLASFLAGFIKRKVRLRSDVVPLVDIGDNYRVESDAPALMLSDFVPLHTIALDS